MTISSNSEGISVRPAKQTGFPVLRGLPLFLVSGSAAAVYWRTAGYTFVFDDFEGILDNSLITRFSHLAQAFGFFKEPWRAVTQLSYALTVYFAGPDPRLFHVTNIIIHVVNSILVFAIARLVARRWIGVEKSQQFALAAGLIHAVHPIYSEAVAYVWGRSSSLCALFYFGSLLLTIVSQEKSGRRRVLWYAGAVLSGILAWKTKEEAITLPFVVAGFFALVGAWRAAAGVMLVPCAIGAARWNDIAELYARVRQNRPLAAVGASPALDPLTYFFTELKASVFYYLRIFVFPAHQNADPYVAPVSRIADPLLLAALLMLAALVVVGIRMLRNERALSFGILVLLVSPLMAYALMPLADPVAEHRVYISGLGFDLLAAWILSRNPRFGKAILAAATLALGLLTLHRNLVWADSLALWRDAELKSPQLARPHLNLGLAYQTAGRPDEALAEYGHALAINPKLAPAYINMSGIYFSRNDLEKAESALKKAAQLSPSIAEPYVDLAVIALRRNRLEEALALIEKAESIEDSYLVHLNKGDILSALRRHDEAAREYRRAQDLRPLK